MALEGNSIAILPVDLGRLTNLTELGFDSATLPAVPSEVTNHGTGRIMQFLKQLEKSRGNRRLVTPFPGLKNGDWFNVTFEGVEYELKVPLTNNMQERERFPAYLPPLSQAERKKMEREGIEFMANTNIGHVLDLDNLGLTEFRLVAMPGMMLDQAQEDFLDVLARSEERPKHGQVKEGDKEGDTEGDKGGEEDEMDASYHDDSEVGTL
eukprot:2817071-Rhodomonas_salina.2